MSENKMLNGVDVGLVESTVEAIKGEPGIAKFKFRAKNQWVNCGYNRSTINDYYGANQEHTRSKPFILEADEPPILAGTDQGANPVEHLLNALAACMTTTLVYHAALRGIRINSVESELEGDIDLRGFLGLSTDVRKGYENIQVRFKVDTDAENLDRLKALSKLSPVFDVTSRGTSVDVQIERK